MVLDYTSGPLSRYGLKFRNHVGAPGEGAADAFHLSNAVIIPEGSRRVVVGGKIGLRSDDTAPRDLAEEIDQAFKNVELALRACGLDKLERSPWEYVYKVRPPTWERFSQEEYSTVV